MDFCRPGVLLGVRRWLYSLVFMADLTLWDVLERRGDVSELAFG